MPEARSTCCYCGVGCGVLIEHEGGRVTGVRGDPEHPANFGRLCSKGQTLHRTIGLSGRALHPEMRAARPEPRRRVGWDEALDTVAVRFSETIRAHGPDAVGFYISGQLLTEDYYVFNKLARALAGTNNIDSNSRLCMSSAVAGYKATLGADGPPGCYEDIDTAECLLIAGSNTAWAHPVLFRRIEDAKRARPAMKIIVVDPRRTATAELADLHLAIQPGTDVALFNAMLHVLLWEGLSNPAWIENHTEGFTALKELVREYSPRGASEVCGVPEAAIVEAARLFGRSNASMSLWCMGLNQSSSGTAKNAALVNLHLATGQIGRPGAGPFSLTGQPNAMGGREVGAMANLLIAHRDLANPAHRDEVARLWGIDTIPVQPGRTAIEMFEAVRSGDIKALWIACTNPAQSMPDQAKVREALERAEFVVLQETFANTETAAYADVLLPAAGWGEKEGTVTNSERRISRVRAAVAPPGEARADWAITTAVARRMEPMLRPGRPTLFAFESAEDVFDEYRSSTRGRGTDITGLSYAMLEAKGPQQWPVPEGADTGTARLYTAGNFPTASGRARFVATPFVPLAEAVDARFPFRLNTGRLRDQWHGMSRTGRVAQLFGHAPEPRLAMCAADMARRGLATGDVVRVRSKRGGVTVVAEANDEVAPGQVFLPMHWGSRFLSGRGALGINAVTQPVFDPTSKQPELKHSAVRIEKVDLPWRFVAFAWPQGGDAVALVDSLQPLLERFAIATCALVGREREGVLLRAANENPVDPAPFDALFGLPEDDVLRYDDAKRGVSRRVRIEDSRIRAARLCGDTAAESWLRDLFVEEASVANLGRLVLAPSAKAPAGFVPRGKIVCSCVGVTESAIGAVLARSPAEPLAALQSELKCGTECGSCVPELKRMVALRAVAA